MENQQQNISNRYEVGQIVGCLTLIEKVDNKWKVKCNLCGSFSVLSVSTLSLYKKNNKEKCGQCPKEHRSTKYKKDEILGNCFKLIEFLGGNYWKVVCTKCGRIQMQSVPNMKKHKKDTCYYCEHPNAQRNPKSSGRRKGVNLLPIDERIYNYYSSRIIQQNSKGSRKYKDWKLTVDDFSSLIHQPCYYCGKHPSSDNMWNKGAQRISSDEEVFINGIDRIDSSKGYTIDNCVSCCKICNRMKSDLSVAEFMNHIKILYDRNICSTTIENTSDKDGSE